MPRKDNKKSRVYNEMVDKNKKIKNSENINSINKEIYIIATLNINKYNIHKPIRIINSFEESKIKILGINLENNYLYENEEEIRQNCIIKINNKIIRFNYFIKFNKEGNYLIKYIFIEKIINADFLFFQCENIKILNLLNLSSFNSQNVTNMSYMFCGWYSLTNLNLSSFNTQNVINMSCMFSECYWYE